MTTSKFLPPRPSIESIRKQAKKLSREVATGNLDAIARVRAQLATTGLPLSQRDAQLILAREYGFVGWQQLKEEALKRIGNGIEWASIEAKHAIHNNNVDRLRHLITDYPALLSWRDNSGAALLNLATDSYGDSGDPFREEMFTRLACAEILIDAGATVEPSVWKRVIASRAMNMLQLLSRKGVLPRTLITLVALNDVDSVRARFAESDSEGIAAINEAFLCACRFKYPTIAGLLLDRCIGLDNELGKKIDGELGRPAFIEYLSEHAQALGNPWQSLVTPWQAFVMNEILRAIDANDLTEFARRLQREPHLLGSSCVSLQVEMIERAAIKNRPSIITQLLELKPALLQSPAPHSSALVFAMEYGNAQLIPLLTSIWPLPDDLPHAAGIGDFDRVKRWFDAAGNPLLGNADHHYPTNNPQVLAKQNWGAANMQPVLDVAFAWSCINRKFEIAAFLLERGANINTNWSTHEPASILHELVFQDNREAMKFLIDHGIDMTIRDHRWNATAEGWALNAAKNEAMAKFLNTEARRRNSGPK